VTIRARSDTHHDAVELTSRELRAVVDELAEEDHDAVTERG
jgi:hypothetical protein